MDIEDLKKQHIWVCFILTQKENHLDKDPISAYGTETGSDKAHAHTWVTYDEAVKAKDEKHYGAVGFAVPEKMAFVDMDGIEPTAPLAKTRMVCSTYRKKGKHLCTSHQIRNSVIERQILEGIRDITAYAREHEDEFVQAAMRKSQEEMRRSQREARKELEASETRIRKLDDIIQHLYEDNIEGKISDERFRKLNTGYEDEQQTLTARVHELREQLAASEQDAANTDDFLTIVRKYTDIQELTPEIIREFVEKVYVYQPEKIDGNKVQHIKIVWNCIGEFSLPDKKNGTAD